MQLINKNNYYNTNNIIIWNKFKKNINVLKKIQLQIIN